MRSNARKCTKQTTKGAASHDDGPLDDQEQPQEEEERRPSPRRTRSATRRLKSNRGASQPGGYLNPTAASQASGSASRRRPPRRQLAPAAVHRPNWQTRPPRRSQGGRAGSRPARSASMARDSDPPSDGSASGDWSAGADARPLPPYHHGTGRTALSRWNANANARRAARREGLGEAESAAVARAAGGEGGGGEGAAAAAGADDPQLHRLLRRLRREHAANDASNANNNANATNASNANSANNNDSNDDDGNGGEEGEGVDAARARYLLEASAGNVGLASALYWEDVAAARQAAERPPGPLLEASAARAPAAASEGAATGSGAPMDIIACFGKRQGTDPDPDEAPSSKKARKGAPKDPDDDDEEGARKPSAAATGGRHDDRTLDSMHRFQHDLDRKISHLQERLSSYRTASASASGGGAADLANAYRSASASGGGGSPEGAALQAALARNAAAAAGTAGSSGAAGGAGANDPAAAAAAAAHGSDFTAAEAAAALRDHPHLLRAYGGGGFGGDVPSRGGLGDGMGGLFPEYGAQLDPEELIHGRVQGEGSRGAEAALAAALRRAGSLEGAAAGLGSHDVRAARGGGLTLGGRGHPPADGGAAAAAGAPGYDFLARALAVGQWGGGGGAGAAAAAGGGGGNLEDAEIRALIAARLAGGAPGAAAAAAGGAGGGDDDGSDDDGDSGRGGNGRRNDDDGSDPNARDDDPAAAEDDDAEDDEAPRRRSARLRSARRPPVDRRPPVPHRGYRPPRRAVARAVAAMEGRRDAQDEDEELVEEEEEAPPDVSDDEEGEAAFLPGPVPVFRLKKGRAGRELLERLSAKRGRGSDDPRHTEAKDDSDDDESASDDESVDIDRLLHASDEYAEPTPKLWDSYPRQADDDESDDDEEDDDGVRIPTSWLRSGFQLSDDGTGLVMRGPTDEEWERTSRGRMHSHAYKHGAMKGVRALFPYNCKGVSALLSIVTAMIYSGASIQGGANVTCDVAKESWMDLAAEQRKRQYDARLVDALAALICLASEAGRRRCQEKLTRYEKVMTRRLRKGRLTPEEEDEYDTKRLALQRRVGLCHVCWWETAADGATLYPAGRNPADVAFRTSFTNAQDIKSYVKTHLRSFKEPGGCALLLETILRAHGPYLDLPCNLLKCRCNESIQHLEKSSRDKNAEAPMPEEHDCVTPELLSLLLTGEIHSTYEDWSLDPLGMGLLRMTKVDSAPVGVRLLRPVKPIWLCLGDLGYSLLLGEEGAHTRESGAFRLSHWNCYSGERTNFTVVTSMHEEEPLRLGGGRALHLISDSDEPEGRTVTDSIAVRLLLDEQRDAALPWRNNGVPTKAPANPDLKPVTDEELRLVSCHPEDEKYYPGQYRRWRFHFGSDASALGKAMASDDGWIPFYRLRGRRRLIVEMKLAPRICGIVRSRWPTATVRDFSPEGKFPCV